MVAGAMYGVLKPGIAAMEFGLDVADGIRGDTGAASLARDSLSNVVEGVKQTAIGVYNEGPYDYARMGATNSLERIDQSFREGDFFGAFSEGAELSTTVAGTAAGGVGLARASASGVQRIVSRPGRDEGINPVTTVQGAAGENRVSALSPRQYVETLKQWPTPITTPAGRFEVEQAGPLNYRVPIGDESFNIDGFNDQTIVEAKYVGQVAKSPYVDGSSAPPFLRAKIRQEQLDEIRRMKAIVEAADNPFESIQIRTNESSAATYFEALLLEQDAPGSVVVVPTNVKPR
jgi:hypothetical protein